MIDHLWAERLTLADLLIAYGLRGLLRRRPTRVALLVLSALLGAASMAKADDAFVVRATSELRLAYIRTGNSEVDAVSRAGLIGRRVSRRARVDKPAAYGGGAHGGSVAGPFVGGGSTVNECDEWPVSRPALSYTINLSVYVPACVI